MRVATLFNHSFRGVATFYRRRLPHLHALDRPVFITWRLHDSLPPQRVFPAELTAGRAFVAMDLLLDQARSGPVYLRQSEIALLVIEAIRYGQDEMRLYESHAWVVMPNHVHLLITPLVEIPKITRTLKRFTARAANRSLGITGQPFWQDESYDHLVRDRHEFERIVAYIHMNPVRAGLVSDPVAFQWSSAALADYKSAAG